MPRVSGIVTDTTGAPAAGRTVRMYRRDTGALIGETTTSVGPEVAGDDFYSTVSLALLGNGADGSTTITDSSVSPKTITRIGDVQIDTDFSMFGGSSILFDGLGGRVSAPNSAAFDFGSGAFSIRFWIRPTAVVAGNVNICRKSTAASISPFSLLLTDNKVRTRHSTNGSAYAVDITGTTVLPTSAFTFVEVARIDNTIYLRVAGVTEASATISGALMTNSSATYIGAGSTGAEAFGGHIDDFVITKGAVRNLADYGSSLPSAYVPVQYVAPAGGYFMSTGAFAGEVNIVALDDSAGDVENDLILRTAGV